MAKSTSDKLTKKERRIRDGKESVPTFFEANRTALVVAALAILGIFFGPRLGALLKGSEGIGDDGNVTGPPELLLPIILAAFVYFGTVEHPFGK
jgi:hypothetical protein